MHSMPISLLCPIIGTNKGQNVLKECKHVKESYGHKNSDWDVTNCPHRSVVFLFSVCPCQLDILLAKIQPPVQEENSKVYSLGTLLLYRDAYLSLLVLDQLHCMALYVMQFYSPGNLLREI